MYIIFRLTKSFCFIGLSQIDTETVDQQIKDRRIQEAIQKATDDAIGIS